jgi:hypothetical protein
VTEPRDAAWNAVAVCSVGYAEARTALRDACCAALSAGLPTEDVAQASGRSADYIRNLIQE